MAWNLLSRQRMSGPGALAARPARWSLLPAIAVLLAASAVAVPARADGDFDLVSKEQVRTWQKAGEQALSTARTTIADAAADLGYSRAEIRKAMEPLMIREFHVDYKIGGTVIRFRAARVGYANNDIANTPRAREVQRERGVGSEINKGGVRIDAASDLSVVKALALEMYPKIAIGGDSVDGSAFAGAKGSIYVGEVIKVDKRHRGRLKVGDIVDPASAGINSEKLLDGYGRAYKRSVGRERKGLRRVSRIIGRDALAGDLRTKGPEMAALSRRLGRGRPSEAVSGKAVIRRRGNRVDPRGGIGFRSVATGVGVAQSAEHAVERLGLDIREVTTMANGWGEVGRAYATSMVDRGARLIGVQEMFLDGGEKVAGVLLNPAGSDGRVTEAQSRAFIEKVDALVKSGQSIRDFDGGSLARYWHPRKNVADYRVDVVGVNPGGPASITRETLPRHIRSGTHSGKRRVLAVGQNLFADDAATDALKRLKTPILAVGPGLASRDGVSTSNMEYAQNRHGREVTDEMARSLNKKTHSEAWRRALEVADGRKVTEFHAVELASVDAFMKSALGRPDVRRVDLARSLFGDKAKRQVRRSVRRRMVEGARNLRQRFGKKRGRPAATRARRARAR